MAIRIVRLGSPREPGEGLRIGTVRRPPRGVKKADYARRDYFDLWFPDLAPSAAVVSSAMSEPWTPARWKAFARRYRAEMKKPEKQRLLELLAELSKQTDFSVGCYCEDESLCHRSLLAELLEEAGADVK
ncbi:MAG TPA: DUF488 family protein [Gemmatimonadaceae bacterium]|nr:DUF488 family protein [Gemmatimonadaceae bacterium]